MDENNLSFGGKGLIFEAANWNIDQCASVLCHTDILPHVDMHSASIAVAGRKSVSMRE